jgi:hypothetical protein
MARDPHTTSHTVTARVAFLCHEPLCRQRVEVGQDYGRHVAFPGADWFTDTRPWVWRLCMPCTTKHDQPVPPRWKRRRR